MGEAEACQALAQVALFVDLASLQKLNCKFGPIPIPNTIGLWQQVTNLLPAPLFAPALLKLEAGSREGMQTCKSGIPREIGRGKHPNLWLSLVVFGTKLPSLLSSVLWQRDHFIAFR